MESTARILIFTGVREDFEARWQSFRKVTASYEAVWIHRRDEFTNIADRFSPNLLIYDDSIDAQQFARELCSQNPKILSLLLQNKLDASNANPPFPTACLAATQIGLLETLITRLTTPHREGHPDHPVDASLIQAIANTARDAVIVLERDSRIRFWSPAAERLFGYEEKDVIGKEFSRLMAPECMELVANIVLDIFTDENGISAERKPKELVAVRKDGVEIPIELSLNRYLQNHQWNAIGVIRNAAEHLQNEAELERLTSQDPLTKLPNRADLLGRMSHLLTHARQCSKIAGVLLLDLDHFAVINESLGHSIGDQLLQAVANRLKDSIRTGDILARHAGDEFAIVVTNLRSESDCAAVAGKLLKAMEPPFAIEERELFISGSIGIATFPRDGEDEHQLLKNSESAMMCAKNSGRKHFEFYTREMQAHLMERMALETDLRQALVENQLILHYQPKIDLRNGRISGVEALIRWQHPQRGLLTPADFLSAAEESGLIVPIGEWVLHSACTQGMAWRNLGYDIVVSVNVAVAQLRDHRFVEHVRLALSESGLPPGLLELELNESILLSQSQGLETCLIELKKLGVQLSIDDFWMGYSSVRELKAFPIDKVKIDRSFVKNIMDSPETASIVGAITSMAHHLNLKVVAAGVETREQQEFLRLRRCDEVQGFLFAKPLPAEDFSRRLEQGWTIAIEAPENQPARTLLLVDDEDNILRSLSRLLRQDGYRIIRTTSPAEALRLMGSHSVGVIVSDQRMPEMSGVEFFRQLKRWYPDTVRLVLSGYTELKSVTDAINEGAVYKFITKPWDDDQLRATIQEAFERYEMKQNNDRLMCQLADTNEQLLRAQQALEQKVREQADVGQRTLDILNVSREVLEYLPVGVLGVDDDGLIVLANQQAKDVLGPGVLGSFADDTLPADLFDCLNKTRLNENAEIHGIWVTPRGSSAECWCHALGTASAGRGTVLVFVEKTARSAG